MKKIIIAVCAVITMMICIASPLFIKPIQANAATVQSEVGVPTETSGNRYITLENILSYYGNDKMYYFVTGQDSYFYTDCLIFDDYDSIDENYVSGNYTYKYRIVRPTLNGGNAIIYSRRVDTSNQYDWKVRCTETEQTGNVLIGNNYISLSGTGITHTFGNNGSGLVSHEENFEPATPTLDVDVQFSPSLSGIVTRQNVSDNGVSKLSNYFSMDITNNSSFDIQYRMRIFDTTGKTVQNWEQGNIDRDYLPDWESGFSINDDGSFVFINDEWSLVSPTIGGGVVKALKPSEWHFISAGANIHQDFSWSQFNLQKDHTYMCQVFAIRNDLGCATALDGHNEGLYQKYGDYCIDFTQQVRVYETVFSITNPAVFNENDTTFGNKIKNGNWQGDKREYSAFEDPTTGNTVIGSGSVSDMRDLPNSVSLGGSHGGGGYSTYHDAALNAQYGVGSGSYQTNRSFSSLNSYFGNYFGFLSSIIGFYPNPYQTLIMIGFAGLVVIGILKAALK